MTTEARKGTTAFDPGRRRTAGVQINLKLPSEVFARAVAIVRASGAPDLKGVIIDALTQHVQTLRVLERGDRIVAMPGAGRPRVEADRLAAFRSTQSMQPEQSQVLTQVNLGFSSSEMKTIREIQVLCGLGQQEVSPVVVQALRVFFWILDLRDMGYPHLQVSKDPVPGGVELRFDRSSELLEEG